MPALILTEETHLSSSKALQPKLYDGSKEAERALMAGGDKRMGELHAVAGEGPFTSMIPPRRQRTSDEFKMLSSPSTVAWDLTRTGIMNGSKQIAPGRMP